MMWPGWLINENLRGLLFDLRGNATYTDDRGRRAMSRKKIKPVHPGEVLLEEFLNPMNLSQKRLALDIGVPPRRINEIVLGKRSFTADTVLRLGRYFRMSPQFWLGLQMDYDLDVTEDAIAKRLDREVKAYAVAA
jgi:addiction module HigA family antidote